MFRGIRPLLRGSTYAGALFAYGGAFASIPLLVLALLPVAEWRSAPYGVRVALALVVWAALIGAVGLAGTTRRVLIVCARRLLGVPLPDPVAVRRSTSTPGAGAAPAGSAPVAPASAVSSGADRRRTSVWLLLHVALGWAGALASGLLLLAALILPGKWLGAEAGVSLFGWTVRATGGWGSWVAALGCLLLAAIVCAAVTYALRWLAPRLLGPSSAERLALAAERELLLAERNRLAHELHDSIGHTLTATTIQAAVAGEVLSADPVAARAALRSIEESARAALEDLDYVLGVLREEKTGTAPTRTLADLPELLDRLRHAGAVVEPELTGELAQVQGTASRAAYRILQEGLTNALRHGAGGPIGVRVAAAPDGLELSVVNRTGAGTGRSPGAFPTSGHGLPGLAERVRLLHGEIEAGPGRAAALAADGAPAGTVARMIGPATTGPGPATAPTTSSVGTPVTLLIADDDEVTRSGLRTLLTAQPGITVVGEAADGVEAVEQARELRPDVVLMDVRMPRRNGIEATRQLLAESAAPPKVVVITTFENDGYVTAALSAGASGFVLKRRPVREIAEAVRVVAAGEAILFPAALRRMVAARPLGSAEALPNAALTGREEEVLRSMATGLSNPEIAESLTVSLETVKTHVGNVLTKLGAQNRTHAVVIAYESGLVVPGFTG